MSSLVFQLSRQLVVRQPCTNTSKVYKFNCRPTVHLQSCFSHLWTKVHQIKWPCAGETAVYNAFFRSTISYFILDIFAFKLGSCPKFAPNFNVCGPPFLEGDPKFLTQFHTFGSPSNICRNLVTIYRATSKLSAEKRKKRHHKTE